MFLCGWLAMTMVAMVPATVPAARLVAVTRGYASGALFLTGYGAVWVAIGVVGYVVFRPLSGWVAWAGAGAALAATALYELSPVKDACLRRCRSPLRILTMPTLVGSLRHGIDCASCCGALMALMVALGLMSWVWLFALTGVMIVQKATPFGERLPRVLGLLLLVAAVVAWS